MVVEPQGVKWLTGERKPVEVDVSQWNEYTVIAQGNRLTHKVNGHVTVELVDHDANGHSLEGLLAFQIHRGPAMTVEIKDVMLKTLPTTAPTAFAPAQIPGSAKKIERPAGKGKGKGDAPNPKKAATTRQGVDGGFMSATAHAGGTDRIRALVAGAESRLDIRHADGVSGVVPEGRAALDP